MENIAFGVSLSYNVGMKTSLENIKSLIRCTVCNHKYEPTKALLLDDRGEYTVLHVTCASCGVATVVFVSVGQLGVISMGVLTDLEGDEARSLLDKEVISSDDVLEMHAFLAHSGKSVKELL